jgi:FSR family fosmidomycin resistance protein-like MFS transporter
VRKLPISLAVISHTVVDASLNILPVILPLLVDRFHLSYSQVGVAAALSSISSSVMQPAFGWVSDRWPARWFMWVGIAWTAILMGCVGLVPNYVTLLLVIFLTGLGTAAFHPIASMAVALASGAQRGLGMSFFSAGGNVGFAVGPVVAAWLVARFGLEGTAAVIAPGLLMAAVVYASRDSFVARSSAPGSVASSPGLPIPWGRLTTLCGVITLRSWGYSGLITFIPLLLHEQGVSLHVAGWSLFVFLFFGALGGLLGGHLSDRLGRHVVIATSLLMFPVLMAMALALSGPLQWVCLATAGATLLASFSVTVVFAQELLPRRLGLASGLTLGLAFGAGGVGVALSGLLADTVGLRTSVWILLALPGIAGLLALTLASAGRAVRAASGD